MQAFKFRFIKGGQHAHVFAKKGELSAEGLVLDGVPIAYADIADTTTRDNRLVLATHGPLPEKLALSDPGVAVLEVYKVPALELERAIDRRSADAIASQTKARLTAEGRAHLFRTAKCPECHATINLSELAQTPHVYCRFCESVFSEGRITKGQEYRCCETCLMFDRVRPYTEFYFYFLLVMYGFSYKRRWLCDGCAGSLFWKVLAVNFIFLLGIAPAVWMKIKSLTGRSADLAALGRANKLMRSGDISEASRLYAQLQDRFGGHPGLYLNEGRPDDALAVCSNYLPAVRS